MKLDKKIKDALELILATSSWTIAIQLYDPEADKTTNDYAVALKKAKAYNLVIDTFELDSKLKIDIKKEA